MLLRRHGGRFATHPIFPFLVFNTEARSTNAQIAAARVSSSRYGRVCEAVGQLDEDSLKKAEEELRFHRKTTNPHVNCLLKEVSIMGQRRPFSNESKMNSRHRCKAEGRRETEKAGAGGTKDAAIFTAEHNES